MVSALDASEILGASNKKRKLEARIQVQRALPSTLDLPLLAVYDTNLIDEEAYQADREAYLQSSTRDSVQLLINSIFNRPTIINDDGIMASLPNEPVVILPREKSLPKPRPPTKWERFAAQKGIVSSSKKERMIFDEEKQEWVPKYGYKGKNRELEDQWAIEVPTNKPADFDPRATAKEQRKARKAKNDTQRVANTTKVTASSAARAATDANRQSRKSAVERALLSTKRSTASLGRFDKTLSGEAQAIGKRPKGFKRKFEANELDAAKEKDREAKVLKSLSTGAGSGGKRADGESGRLVSARKALRASVASKGERMRHKKR